ncbi:oligosaccharide flippase family protein [Maribacter sp. 2307ULW6-5]|uniref:oligosaccharide flippase family protein n=1 Tax=Maribacter sp. 2307ULW6-5 TaxID=3386275 RepID=UPI0039BD2158
MGLDFKSKIVKNSMWGLTGSLVQNVLLSLFYVLVARFYEVADFAQYVIANSLYQMIVAFSAMGLGQWFIREVVKVSDKNALVAKFMKMQVFFGLFFFMVNLILAFALYQDTTVRILSLLFAVNIVFDNIIYSIKSINIAQYAQEKTVKVLTIEALAKFSLACFLYLYPISIFSLVIVMVAIRFLTLNLFLRIGAAEGIVLTGFWKADLPFAYVRDVLHKYWPFAVIGSLYVVYWRSAALIISKFLPLKDVVHFENSFKIFTVATLVPMVVSTTLLPKFVSLIMDNKMDELKSMYQKIFLFLMGYGLLAFTFTYSFAADLLPWIFGEKYADTALYAKEMFFTLLVFPTALLQANILIAMKLEKLDMWFNLNSVLINTLLCIVGLYFYESLSVVNYSILVSFIIFHLSQDVVLYRRDVIGGRHIILFMGVSVFLVLGYMALSGVVWAWYLFPLFWLVVGGTGYFVFRGMETPRMEEMPLPNGNGKPSKNP